MSHPELLILGLLRALAEISLLFLLGQGLLALLAGQRRHSNTIYQLFVIVTRPVLKLVRMIAPPQIIDKHLPFVAFFLLFWLWIGLAFLKKIYCDANLLQCF
ncbi:MAG: hypothetical protein KKF85_05665 [Gammaproteobacteria bacterium]|nr:hypothetical protein [Rhodocyclaceae bacterium]MBU3910601.1 hypothetical protein [Gammaproteobacteria bacterium]MBU3989482.1 hypothetical protein [Gammaproteobacteria bacterium]MBU4005082.1 hypothetical protein [Gammaproteobacteria bacterium]MBU4020675.1 hypothetical protein [Gammaproteobacteria bacterium]